MKNKEWKYEKNTEGKSEEKNTAGKYENTEWEYEIQQGNMKKTARKYEKHSREICQACSGHLGA